MVMPPLHGISKSEVVVRDEAARRWGDNSYIESGGIPTEPPNKEMLDNRKWEYQSYLRLKCVWMSPGGQAYLWVHYLLTSIEDHEFCAHPTSDKVMTIVQGRGTFSVWRYGRQRRTEVIPGMRLWIPRHELYILRTNEREGMYVSEIHNPWVSREDSQYITYVGIKEEL